MQQNVHHKSRLPRSAASLRPANVLPEPTLQLDDTNSVTVSQVYDAAAQAALAADGGRRARPRVVIPPAQVEEELQLTAQGKITAKNAWSLRLIDGMKESLGVCMLNECDQYAQFTRAAHLVEGGAKIWTHRVDSVYLLSTQMVKRLLRNDVGADGNGEHDDSNDAQQQEQSLLHRRRRKPMERTLADQTEELNAEGAASLVAVYLAAVAAGNTSDLGQKGAMTAHGALFRAVTEKFDQGHTQGLLSNTTRPGLSGNIVLDRDYTADDAPERAALLSSDIVVAPFDLNSGATIDPTLLVQLYRDAASFECPVYDDMMVRDDAAMMPHSRAQSVLSLRGPSAEPTMGDDSDDLAPYDDIDAPPSLCEDDVADLVSGRRQIEMLDQRFNPSSVTGTALAAELPGVWVPLSQHGGVVKRPRRLEAAATGVSQKKNRKKLRSEPKHTVQFIGATGTQQSIDTSENALRIDVDTFFAEPRKPTQVLSSLGKQLFDELSASSTSSTMRNFANADHALKTAERSGLMLPVELFDPLPSWCGAAEASHKHSVSDFFQPFNSAVSHWNLLSKTAAVYPQHQPRGSAAPNPAESDFADDAGDWPDNDTPQAPDYLPIIADVRQMDIEPPQDAAGEGAIDLLPPPEQLPTLSVCHATVPSSVDVAKLRSIMWRRTEELLAGGRSVLFSDVIGAMMSDVPQISKDGILSPAFYFFSLLFLTNEKSLDLRQIVGLDEWNAARRSLSDAARPQPDQPTPKSYVNPRRVVERVGCDVVVSAAE